MTPTALLTIASSRAGLHNPTIPQTDRARSYLNIIKTELEGMADWRALYKVGTITTVASLRAYDLASDVLYPLQFWDKTNNKPCKVRHPEEITLLDPDENQTGEGIIVSITGRDTSTGYWEVDIYPTPDTASESIKYRYKALIADFASSGDSTDMAAKYPAWMQNALLWGTSALMKEDQNQDSARDWEKYTASVNVGIKINNTLNVPPRIIMERSEDLGRFTINATVQPD